MEFNDYRNKMQNLIPKEKRITKEIEQIRDIIYGYSEEDPEWIRDVRPYKLDIERDELIRNFIISHHLLTEEFLNTKLLEYFIKYKRGSKRYQFFEEFILQKLTYREKIELAYKANLISKGVYKFLEELNSLRNKCAHRWFLKDKKIKLLYKGKDLLRIKNFEIFAEDVFTLHEILWQV